MHSKIKLKYLYVCIKRMLVALLKMLLILYLISMNIPNAYSACSVTHIVMQVPRENAIGLIFDLTLTNLKTDKSEMLEFAVSSNNACSLNLTNGQQVQAGTLFGGDFGSIEPGSFISVSLVLPTVSLYNRVGSCEILITCLNQQIEVTKTKHKLFFDTRFETLDPSNHSLRRRKDFTDCKNWDKEYLKNCTPVNCEERYFGKRSFYNKTTEQCEGIPPCFGDAMIYDFYANECTDMNNFIMDEEIEQLKMGKFDNNFLELQTYMSMRLKRKPQSSGNRSIFENHRSRQTSKICSFDKQVSLVDFNNCFQNLQYVIREEQILGSLPNVKLKRKSIRNSILSDLYYDWYMPYHKEIFVKNSGRLNINISYPTENYSSSNAIFSDGLDAKAKSGTYNAIEWFIMTVQVLLIILLVILFQVIVTFLSYAIVCVAVYTILKLIADLKPGKFTGHQISEKLTPRVHQKSYDIMTSASLMTQLK